MTATAPIVAPRPVLSFEDETHTYRIDGRRVFSVTQALSAAYGDLCWPWANEFAMERGRRVHQALNYWIRGELDVKKLSDYIAGYVAAGIRFFNESGFEIGTFQGEPASEVRMYSHVYDAAGTADLFGTLYRKRACVDFKTGEPGWIAGPQTWAYTAMWQEMTGEVIRERYALRLYEDGSYQLVPYKDHRNDQADFLAALRVAQRRNVLGALNQSQGEEFV
jgi:hypothetical protein